VEIYRRWVKKWVEEDLFSIGIECHTEIAEKLKAYLQYWIPHLSMASRR